MMVVGCPFGRLLPGEGMTGQDRHFDKVLLLREGQVRATLRPFGKLRAGRLWVSGFCGSRRGFMVG